MTERLFQYIWQLQHFNLHNLITVQGERLAIVHPGTFNTNQGPDFLDGRILLNRNTWAGNIELHLKTSDWKKHAHDKDENYKNIILHVVWENDLGKGALYNMPTLELKSRVSLELLNKYNNMMNQDFFIPCENSMHQVPSILWSNWKQRILLERLQRKAQQVYELLQKNTFNWEEALWWMMARNFGMKVNADAFESIARSIPLRIINRHRNQIHQLEALLLGQASLLEGRFKDQYPQMLQREYIFLKNKYSLIPADIPVLFLRMRPPGFPSVRLAQLAMFIKNSGNLFSLVKECTDLSDLKKLLEVTANDYWHYHYRLDESSPLKPKMLGSDTIRSIIINTIIPVLYCYGSYYGLDYLIEKALAWMDALPSEKNKITRGWEAAGMSQESAFCSQALIELKTQYCEKKRCLDCAIGNNILKRSITPVCSI